MEEDNLIHLETLKYDKELNRFSPLVQACLRVTNNKLEKAQWAMSGFLS